MIMVFFVMGYFFVFFIFFFIKYFGVIEVEIVKSFRKVFFIVIFFVFFLKEFNWKYIVGFVVVVVFMVYIFYFK